MRHVLLATMRAVAVLLAAAGAARAQSGVTIALSANVNTLDPHMSATIGTDLSVLSHIYPALLLRGPDLKLQPALATAWMAESDTVWRIDLVAGARFADGEAIDADTVKWNLERVRDPKLNARIRPWFDPIASVEVISPTSLRIVTSAPYPALPDQLTMFLLLPPQWTQSHHPAAETMSGGRYAVAENIPGDRITLKANPGWWGDKPAFDQVVFRTLPEAASRIAAVKTGEVDLITGIPPSEIAGINASGRATAGAVPSGRSVFIKFNTEVKPLDNRLFRQALNYAVDKQGIADALFAGTATPSTCQLLTPDYFGYNPALQPYPYDPAKAAELLQQSGVPKGTVLQMDVPVGVYLQGQEVTQAVADQLGELGLQVKITEMDFGMYMNKYLKSRTLAQTSLLSHAWPTLDADGELSLLAGTSPYAYYHNPEYDALLAQGRSVVDPAQRRAFYAKATQVFCDDAGVLFLYTQPATFGVSRRVTWHARGDDWVRAWDIDLKK